MMNEKANMQSLCHFCKTKLGILGKYISKMPKIKVLSIIKILEDTTQILR